MVIDAVEELGANRLVHGHVGGEALTVVMPADMDLPPTLRLKVEPQDIHLFQAETGAKLV